MKWPKWSLTFLTLSTILLMLGGPVSAAQHKRQKSLPAGPLITIYVPHPEQLELALDEVELDWSGDPGAKGQAPGHYAAAIPGTRVVDSDAARATIALSGVTDPVDLSIKARALKAANPGAEYHLVLYKPGLPRSTETRRLLTREVGMLLEQGEEPRGVLAGLPAGPLRTVAGVPGGYVVEAGDPMAALDLADQLRGRPGVRSAYPLLKRQHFPR
jgi:hypothetical protein